MTTYRYYSDEEVAALRGGVQQASRPAAGPRVAATSRAVSPEPQAVPVARQKGFDLGDVSTYADQFRNIVPQGARDALGAVGNAAYGAFKFVDTPISERLGIRVPDMAGPLDEIANFALEEVTRPTNYIAGLGLASKAKQGSRLVKAAGFFLDGPSRSQSFVNRAAAQAVMMTGARASSEAANKALDAMGVESTPVRIGVGLLSGIAGGGLTVAGINSAAKGTLGRDLMGSGLDLRAHVTDATRTGAQAVPRRGVGELPWSTAEKPANVLSLTTSDELVASKSNTVDYITHRVLPDLDRQRRSQAGELISYARKGYQLLGEVQTTDDGIQQIVGRKSGRTVNLIDALDFGVARYGADLSDKQIEGITRMRAVAQAARSTHGALTGGQLNEATLIEGQDFFPRRIVGEVDSPSEVTKRTLGLSYEPGRKIPDALQAQIKDGVRYDNPLATLEEYVDRNLSDAVSLHIQDLLKHPDISTSWWSRVNKELMEKVAGVRSQIRQVTGTLTGQEARASEARRVADSAQLSVERAAGRVVTAQERVARMSRDVDVDDVKEAQRDVTDAIARHEQAVRDAERAIASAKALGRADDVQVKRMERALLKANTLRAEAEGYRSGFERIDENIAFSTEQPKKAGPWDVPGTSGRRIPVDEGGVSARPTPADSLLPVDANLSAEDALSAARSGDVRMDVASDNARIAARETLRQQYVGALRASDRLYAMYDGLTEQAARLAERLDDKAVEAFALQTGTTGTRAEISMARAAERSIGRQERAVYGAQRDLRALEREEARAIREAVRRGTRADVLAKMREKSAERLAKLREGVTELQVRVADNKERARLLPGGRSRLPEGQFPLLAGRDFDKADAEIIRKAFTHSLTTDTQAGTALSKVAAINRHITPARAMLDMSSVLNQMGWMLFSHPVTFTRNFAKAASWMVNPSKYDDFITNPVTQDAIQHGVVVMGRGMRESLRQSEFELGSWIERVPVARELADHFRIFTTLNRVDVYNGLVNAAESSPRAAARLKAGLEGATATAGLSDVDKDSVARAINRLSGIATGIDKGPAFFKGGRPGDLETALLFAPGFLRSGFETVIAATMDGGIEGSLARQYIRNMVVGAQMMAVTVAGMQGRDVSEVTNPFDVKAMERGEFRLNPNFGTIRLGGQDISLYGRWDSLARLAVSSADAPMRSISALSAKPLLEALDQTISSKGAPLASLLEQVLTDGQTYNGNDTLSVTGLIENFAPFTWAGFAEDLFSGDSLPVAADSAALSFLGAKANEPTPFEQLDSAARAITGKPYDRLTGQERDNVRAAVPGIVARADRQTARRAEGGDVKAQARVELEKIDEERMASEAEAYSRLQTGDINIKQFNDALKQYAFGAAREKGRVQSVLGIEYGTPKGAQAALSEFFETYRKAEIAPDIIDFEVQEQLEAELSRRIDGGEFGDPAAAHAAINERSRPKHSPEVQAFYDARQRVSESGYYDVVDEAYQRVRPTVARMLEADLETYGEFQVALNRAERSGDTRAAARLKALDRKVQSLTDPVRKRMRLQNPQLEADLVATGRVDATSNFHRAATRRAAAAG